MKRVIHLGLLIVIAMGTGCATVPYQYGQKIENVHAYKLQPDEPQIVRGKPHALLDASDWIWPGSLLGKLLLWNWKVDRHHISPETEEALRAYIEANELQDVKVRLNAYSVGDEWRRTMRNKAVGPGWRYTLGFLSWLGYTIMPQRFFGGDNYNPYSNTINIYSDIVPIALHEGGHAKDFARRTYKGTYGALYSFVPFFNLYPEAIATSDALSYSLEIGDAENLRGGYHVLYPAYGTYLGGNFGQFAGPWYYAFMVAGVIPGHIVGRIKGAMVEDPLPVPQHNDGN